MYVCNVAKCKFKSIELPIYSPCSQAIMTKMLLYLLEICMYMTQYAKAIVETYSILSYKVPVELSSTEHFHRDVRVEGSVIIVSLENK